MRTRLFVAALGLLCLLAIAPRDAGAQPPPPAAELHEDALIPPPPPPSLAGSDNRGPSQYMAGRVAVQLLLPESASAEQNWSQAQIDLIHSQVQSALDWWAARLPGARLSFVLRLEVVPTAYEPINYGLIGEGRWISDALRRRGYASGSYFDQVYAADRDLRDELDADWSTTIFVVNSQGHDGGTFPDGRFAYAYINGPFMVLTSDVGGYGANRMAPVVAHELGHIFGALDQYAAARVDCAQTSGYLNVPTTNSQYNGCGTSLPSIMIETVGSFNNGNVDPSALAQIGYRDSDGDGLIDPLDTAPALTLNPVLVGVADNRPVISGQAVDVGFPAPYHQVASVNSVSSVEYRVDGGIWLPAPAADGAFDSGDESFALALPLYDGEYRVELRARNSVGGLSPTVAQAITVSDVGPQPDYSPSLPEATGQAEVQVQLGAPAGTQAVQISADPGFATAAWQAYAAELPFSLAQSDGQQAVYLRYRDAAGLVSLPYAFTVTLDTTPPAGLAMRDPQNPGRLLLDAHDDGSGVTEIGLQIDAGALRWMPYQSDIDLGSLSSLAGAAPALDTALVQVRFRDAVGNTSAPYTITSTSTYVVNIPIVVR